LIRTGFCSCIETALATQSDAAAVANVLRVSDPYCVAVAEQNAVRFYRAKSQRMRAMEKEEFQQSKDAVLDFLSKLIGTDTTTLQQQAGQAA